MEGESVMEKKLPSRIRRKRNIKIKKSTVGIFVTIFAFVFSMFYVFAGENPKLVVTKIENANVGDTVVVRIDLQTNKEYNRLRGNAYADNFDYLLCFDYLFGNVLPEDKNQKVFRRYVLGCGFDMRRRVACLRFYPDKQMVVGAYRKHRRQSY